MGPGQVRQGSWAGREVKDWLSDMGSTAETKYPAL